MNPYPTFPANPIAAFFLGNVWTSRDVEKLSTRSVSVEDLPYVVMKDFKVNVWLEGRDIHTFTIPAGLCTDFSSVPRICRSVVSRVGLHTEASVVHDWLYSAWLYLGLVPTEEMRIYADLVMLRLMESVKVENSQRWFIYNALVEFGSPVFFNKDKGEILTSQLPN